jgi:hypothetical protein
MGCDLLIQSKEGNLPCKAGIVSPKTMRVTVVETVGFAEKEALELAEKYNADIVKVHVTETVTKEFELKELPLSMSKLHERIVEARKINKNKQYIVKKLVVGICDSCPLNVGNRVVGILAPPCSIRTAVYARFSPTLMNIMYGGVDEYIDIIKSEAEKYTPINEEDKKLLDGFKAWIKAVKTHVKGKGAVFFNWC